MLETPFQQMKVPQAYCRKLMPAEKYLAKVGNNENSRMYRIRSNKYINV